jgi:peptidoglycan/xylan/chitin deacetylase (PgdA/CDA1 family)
VEKYPEIISRMVTEGHEVGNHTFTRPIMRLVRRPLLGWVMWKSLLKALKGVWVGWGKLERTGVVSLS